jgi:hypothetical protein
MKTLHWIALCCMYLTAPSTAFAADIFRLWHGVGIQGTQSEWSTEVDLRAPAATVKYPSLKCSGTWTPLGVQNEVYEYHEVITIGRDKCIDGYVSVALIDDKRMAIHYREIRNGEIIATSVVFPGPHHEDQKRAMIKATRAYIAETVR